MCKKLYVVHANKICFRKKSRGSHESAPDIVSGEPPIYVFSSQSNQATKCNQDCPQHFQKTLL